MVCRELSCGGWKVMWNGFFVYFRLEDNWGVVSVMNEGILVCNVCLRWWS